MPQLGTGHAVQQAGAAPARHGSTTLILNGDVPLIDAGTAPRWSHACGGARLALLTIGTGRPHRLRPHRARRPAGRVQAIVEHKDATPAQREIREIYTGMMAAPTALLKRWVTALRNDNAQKEYYLTDIVAMAVAEGVPVVATQPRRRDRGAGRQQPRAAGRPGAPLPAPPGRRADGAGVRLADPARFDVRGTLQCGSDVDIDVGCVFEGDVTLGDDVRIGAHCVIRNAASATAR
jgi:bifunctional UDP-N-acetylglucosamine pyrophosphorylase/glucosamine-1-phosphate N-acetyltransferase